MESIRTYWIAFRNILLGTNLISIILMTNPRNYVGIVSTLLFHFKTLSGRRRLQQRNPEEIFGTNRKFDITIDTDCYFWGCDSSYTKDILTLCIMTKLTDAKKIFEIGTLDGYSALHFAMNSSPESKIYTLDLPIGFNEKPVLKTTKIDDDHQSFHDKIKIYRFQNTEYEKKIQCLFGDSGIFDFGPYENQIDLFFIDGSHSYEYVKSDTFSALKCVKSGGIIAWHDYGRMGVNGVSKWLHEYEADGHKVYSVPGSSVAFFIKD